MYLKVEVVASATQEKIDTTSAPDHIKVWVRERAQGNAANDRMLAMVRMHFKVHGPIRIVSGHHSPHKIIALPDASER